MSHHSRIKLGELPLPEAQNRILMIKDLLASTPEKDYSLNELAETAVSPWSFLRHFKNIQACRHAWLIQLRLHRAKQLLKRGENIALASDSCGFSHQSHLNRHFKKAMAVTPMKYVMGLR